MRDGFRIIDTDTHVGPNVETLRKYASPTLEERWSELEPYSLPATEGHHLSISPMPYKRSLRTPADTTEAEKAGKIPMRGKTTQTFREDPQPEVQNANVAGRLEDMDKEGVDVHVIIPATFATAISALDVDLGLEVHAAYNRYIVDYCSADPKRLKGAVVAHGGAPEAAAKEIQSYVDEACIAAVIPVLPEGLPPDDPSLDPIWATMNDADLPILHHSFFYEPPYFPGYRDIWGNLAVARMAAHPWGAQRLLAYVTLSGLLDEFPNLRIGFAECSGGWMAGWLNRMEYQANYLAKSLPETEQTPIEYAKSGRIYCGIELGEGEAMVESVNHVLGDGVLMYQSDYPHPGCEFPDSPKNAVGWKNLGEDSLRKLMSENAERYLRLL